MDYQTPVRRVEARRHGRARPEVQDLDCARHHDLGNAGATGGLEAVGTGGEDAAQELVREFAHRVVDDAVDGAGPDHLLHGSSTRAHGVEGDRLEPRAPQATLDVQDAQRRDAEHRDGDQRPVVRARLVVATSSSHASCRESGIAEDAARDAVQARDIRHGAHDRYVGCVGQAAKVLTHSGHQQLRDAKRHHLEDRRRYTAAARARRHQHRVASAFPQQPGHHRRRSLTHGFECHGACVAALSGETERRKTGAGSARDGLGRDVRPDTGPAEHADIDQDDCGAGGFRACAEIAVLDSLGVQRSEENYGAHGGVTHAADGAVGIPPQSWSERPRPATARCSKHRGNHARQPCRSRPGHWPDPRKVRRAPRR